MTIHIVNKYHPHVQGITPFYCGRGSALGNPYVISPDRDRDYVCDQYEKYFNHNVNVLEIPEMVQQLHQISAAAKRGNISLVCYCAPKRCHCETIKRHIEEMS